MAEMWEFVAKDSLMLNPSTLHQVSALVLAGGRGTRIASLHPDLPKPMVPVAGHPFLEWFVRRLVNQGFSDILMSTGYRAEVIEAWAKSRTPLGGEQIRCIAEESAMGTGGAIAYVLPHIRSDITVIMNGDTLFFAELAPGIQRLRDGNLDGVIFARSVEDTSRYGSLEVGMGMLEGFREKQPGQGLINGGILAFKTSWLRQNVPPGVSSFEADILPSVLRKGALIGVNESEAAFIDIGTPKTLGEADLFVATHAKGFEILY